MEGTKHDFTSVLSGAWVCAQWVKTTLCNEQGGLSLSKFKYSLEHVLWPLCMSRMDCSPNFGSCVESNNSNTQGVDERLVLTLQVPLGLTRQASQVGMKCFERAGKEPGWAFMVVSGWDWAESS